MSFSKVLFEYKGLFKNVTYLVLVFANDKIYIHIYIEQKIKNFIVNALNVHVFNAPQANSTGSFLITHLAKSNSLVGDFRTSLGSSFSFKFKI